MSRTISPTALRALLILLLAIIVIPTAFADGPYIIGSANTVTADPTIPRPSTTPCIVQLMSNAEFDNFNPVSFPYTPPADCPGPWAKVVFTADINVTAGIQYDRTANFWLGGTVIYFGTTAEPSPTLGPSWHVESDLTDYSPLFMTSQQGTADIGNLVNTTYTGIIYASATLEFYPVPKGQTAPITSNVVLPLSAGSTGGTVSLGTTTDTLSATYTFPTNIQNAYLDVYSQSQSNDEFWYTCVPNDVSTELESCGNTGFRETEVTIDGTPAGVAPVSPWIYTGGIDPWLWFPIPGVQTLNFVPYRVDLTPFAALLSNGAQHTVSVSVFNADSYFSDTASLLLYLDSRINHGQWRHHQELADRRAQSGRQRKPQLRQFPHRIGRCPSNRNFTISGFVNTSHGKVTTTISQKLTFSNNQSFDIGSTEYIQNINLKSGVNSTTTVATSGQPTITTTRNWQFPLTLDVRVRRLERGRESDHQGSADIFRGASSPAERRDRRRQEWSPTTPNARTRWSSTPAAT